MNIPNGTYTSGYAYGNSNDNSGTNYSGTPNNNILNINSGGTVDQYALGGFASNYSGASTANNNSVTVNSGGTVTGNVYGGQASGTVASTATGNSVTVNSGGTVTGNVYGGFAAGGSGDTATDNTVTINGGTFDTSKSIYGGMVGGGGGDAFTRNTLELNSIVSIGTVRNFEFIKFGNIGNANITTLNTTPTGAAGTLVKMNTQGNNITFDGVITGSGGIEKIGTGTLTLSGTNNYSGGTTVSAGTLAGNTSSLQGNILNNANVEFAQTTDGTYAGTMSGTGSLTKDGAGTLTLTGTNIYSGLTTVQSGTLDVSSGSIANSSGLELYGGSTFIPNTGYTLDNKTLTVRGENATYGGDLSAQNATLNFIAPVNIAQPMLNVAGNADVSNSVVNVGVSGGTALPTGTELVLLNVAGTLTGAATLTEGSGIVESGVTRIYGLTLAVDPQTGNLIGTVTSGSATEQSKALSEARLSQLAFNNQGSDLIAGQGLFAALDALDTAARRMKKTTVFGAISGGSSRYKTGSHSDVTGLSLITGLAGNSRLALGKLTLGAFFEYGNANYDSYNSFTNAASVRGNGKTDYTGGGVLAHLEFNPTARGNAWLESSARFGRATVDFQTNDMLGNLGKRTAFDSDSNYAAAHFGIGYHWKLTKQNGLDFYAQYLWSRQNADTAELTTNETVKFETANSERLRLGTRFVYNLNPHRRVYAGIAWEHEFDGESKASILGYQLLDTPKLTGDTCKLELGLTLQPTKTCPITRNFGIQGYTGKREGVAGSVEVRWEF